MTRAQVMQWLLTLGNDWVGLGKVYGVYRDTYANDSSFWDVLDEWHDGAYITKRINTAMYEKHTESYIAGVEGGIEQYKLTKKALTLLGERTSDD